MPDASLIVAISRQRGSGGAAVGLGLINPFAALIPLLAPSNNKPLPCNQLLAQVRQAPTAPPSQPASRRMDHADQ